MHLRHLGEIGILPAGALGVAFADQLTSGFRKQSPRVVFLSREGSASGAALASAGVLRLADRVIENPELWRPDLRSCAAAGWLPDVVLVCTQPDQLNPQMAAGVRLLEELARGRTVEEAVEEWPVHILCANGIYFQRVRQFLLEKLEEAVLFGRLPDLWPVAMPRLIGKLIRGVTVQTGQRSGNGFAAVYRPGPPGLTRLAGGDAVERDRCARLLAGSGPWFEAAGETPTRVEFDKALVNLTVNLLGQSMAIADTGNFQTLTVGQILDRGSDGEARQLAEEVIRVGRAVGAFGVGEDFETLFAGVRQSSAHYLNHVPSSLQWIAQMIADGTPPRTLSPTERWLLDPLIRYAEAAELPEAGEYFRALARRVEERLGLLR